MGRDGHQGRRRGEGSSGEKAGGGGGRGVRSESQGGRTRRPNLAQPPEQQEQGENQFRNEKTSVGDLVVVEPEN